MEKIKLNYMKKFYGAKKVKTAVFISGKGSNGGVSSGCSPFPWGH